MLISSIALNCSCWLQLSSSVQASIAMYMQKSKFPDLHGTCAAVMLTIASRSL